MGRLIDEIIATETEIAQEFQEVIDTHVTSHNFSLEEMYCDDTEAIEEYLQRCKDFADYHNQIADTMRKYQQLQADYEARLKADMVAILKELQLEIEELEKPHCHNASHADGCVSKWRVEGLIQQKINALKGE